jgi:hypothetical protein
MSWDVGAGSGGERSFAPHHVRNRTQPDLEARDISGRDRTVTECDPVVCNALCSCVTLCCS